MSGAHQLYRHYDQQGQLLYVGVSLNAMARLQQHASTAGWFSKIRSVTIEQFESREKALSAERLAIVDEAPLFNIKIPTRLDDPICQGATLPAPERAWLRKHNAKVLSFGVDILGSTAQKTGTWEGYIVVTFDGGERRPHGTGRSPREALTDTLKNST